MRAIKDIITYTVMVMLGLILFSGLKEMLSCKDENAKTAKTKEEPAFVLPEAVPLAPQSTSPKKSEHPKTESKHSYDVRLKRFGELRKKVLLNDQESVERERILSNVKTIESTGKRLVDPNGNIEIQERLSMIDYLEDAAAWEDNPLREDVLGRIEDVIRSETFVVAEKDIKRHLVGDKIELFTILSEQASSKAASLLDETKGTKLEAILKYAAKRLPTKTFHAEK